MNSLPHAIEKAIEWQARRSSGVFSDQEQVQFQYWLEADPSHQAAWNQLQQSLHQRLAVFSQAGTRQALQTPAMGRRTLLRGALALGGLTFGAHLLTQPGRPLFGWNADVKTATAERRHLVLAEGAQLLLNAETAIRIEQIDGLSRVTLVEGSLLAKTAAPQQSLHLSCDYGTVQLSDGRCLFELRGTAAWVRVLAGNAQLQTCTGAQKRLSAGQGAQLSAQDIRLLPPSEVDPTAWRKGQLPVNNQSLATVIEQLRPYHRGVLQLAPEAAELRISGVFNLDDSEQALKALADILPIRIRHYFGYWTRIESA